LALDYTGDYLPQVRHFFINIFSWTNEKEKRASGWGAKLE